MQPLTRLASRLGKTICTIWPSWRSELSPLQGIPSTALALQREQRRSVSCGGESETQEASLLDPFLGRWVELRKENYSQFLSAVGVPKELHKDLEHTKGDITFRRCDQDWTVETGSLNSLGIDVWTFNFDDEIHQELITGQPIKSVRYQDGPLIRERHVTCMGPKKMMTVVNEVVGDKLTITSRLAGVTAKVIYERSRS